MTLAPLPRVLIEPLVRAALLEDLGRAGDLTTDMIVPLGHQARTALVARENGVIAGLDLAKLAFELIDPLIAVQVECADGAITAPGKAIVRVSGPARGILTAERTALNFLGHLSGISSATARLDWPMLKRLHPRQTKMNCGESENCRRSHSLSPRRWASRSRVSDGKK